MALIGGGIDMGRAYMARTQLQSACDAGVLAGRRAMGGTGEYAAAERAKARRMFDFNFDAGHLGARQVTFSSAANDEGQVAASATAIVPTAVMDIFGMRDFALRTDCMAELQVANADIMFVLDTTGSMGGTRIAGLREAVRDFHRTLNAAIQDDATRVRYGFVPYSMTVNAGELVSGGELPADYLAESAPYESREAYFGTPVHVGTTSGPVTTYETYSQSLSSSECAAYGANGYPYYAANPSVSGTAPAKVTSRTYSYYSWTGSGTRRTCTRKVVTTETTYATRYAFTNWRYKQTTLDTSALRTGASVPVATGLGSAWADAPGYYDAITMAKRNGSILHGLTLANMRWAGCIEERDTVDSADWNPVPGGAYDLDLDLAPTSAATRWRPMLQDLVYYRNYYNYVDTTSNYSPAYSACPSPMKLFTEVELSADANDVPAWLDSYLNGLVATGNTYHDIGMVWGGRLASPNGIFAANVNKDDKAVSRHLIFMTDGQMEPYIWGENAYGIEVLSNRVAPRGSDTSTVTARHTARLLAACEAVKAKGITVWVIAFGTSLTGDLVTCASDGRAYRSSNTEELKQRFRFIASQVANLRLGA